MEGAAHELERADPLTRFCIRCGGPLPRGSEESLCAVCVAIDSLAQAFSVGLTPEQVTDTIAHFARRGWTSSPCSACGRPVPQVSSSTLCMECTLANLLRSRPLADEVELARALASQGILPDTTEAIIDASRVSLGWPSRVMSQLLGVAPNQTEQLSLYHSSGDESQMARNRKAFGSCYVQLLSAPPGVVDRPPSWVQPIPWSSSEPQTLIQWRAWHAQASHYLVRVWYDPVTQREQRRRYGQAEPAVEQAVDGYLAFVRAGAFSPLGAPRGGDRPPREVLIAQMRAAYESLQQKNLHGPLRRRARPTQEDVAEAMDIRPSTLRRWRKELDVPYPPPPANDMAHDIS